MEVYAEMLQSVRELLPQEKLSPTIYDVSDLFADITDPVYIDYVHMSGRGNQVIAEELVEILRLHFCRDLPPRVSGIVRLQVEKFCD